MIKKLFILLIFLIVAGVPMNSVSGYLDGTLIRADGYNKVYVLENGLKRWVTNLNVFTRLGYKWSNVRIVTKAVVDSHISGSDLNSSYSYPNGSLLKGDGPEVYLIEAGKKRWIPNPEIFNSKGFQWQRIIKINQYTLNSLKQGNNIISEKENLWPTTWLVKGSCKQSQSEIPIIDSTEVSFKFSGNNPTGLDKDLSFETFLKGYDQRWQYSYSYERKINLGQGSKTYTFYVRAKNQDGYYDRTPTFCSFKTKISSYKDKITIYSVSGWSDVPKYESITIGANYNLGEAVNITDWVIKANKRRFFIPQAMKTIHPESIYNYKEDIYLNRNERITIYGGPSPIEENAFGINKCWRHINDAEKYEECYYEYNQDPNFLTGQYRVYLNRTTEMFDKQDEKIILYDKESQIIDTYEY